MNDLAALQAASSKAEEELQRLLDTQREIIAQAERIADDVADARARAEKARGRVNIAQIRAMLGG